jgi:hypothetical protein
LPSRSPLKFGIDIATSIEDAKHCYVFGIDSIEDDIISDYQAPRAKHEMGAVAPYEREASKLGEFFTELMRQRDSSGSISLSQIGMNMEKLRVGIVG